VHSLHAYFLRRGDFTAPIVYQVERSLDGQSFSNRRVIAIQHGQQIFNMAASYQVAESGLEHQIEIPSVVPPESLQESAVPSIEPLQQMPERVRRFLEQPRPFEFRLVDPTTVTRRQVWFRAAGQLPDDEALHRSLLAYVSDFFLLDTATLPHHAAVPRSSLTLASLDHAMWFHRSLRVDDWLLYALESPSASGARGFARASVFARDGVLVASIAQEGLVRIKRAT
jgi:acyl-CoA thioesterase-2